MLDICCVNIQELNSYCCYSYVNIVVCFSADQIPLLRLHGSELTVEYLQKNGFDLPILVEKVDGLNVKLPRSNFSIQDVENHVGECRLCPSA